MWDITRTGSKVDQDNWNTWDKSDARTFCNDKSDNRCNIVINGNILFDAR